MVVSIKYHVQLSTIKDHTWLFTVKDHTWLSTIKYHIWLSRIFLNRSHKFTLHYIIGGGLRVSFVYLFSF